MTVVRSRAHPNFWYIPVNEKNTTWVVLSIMTFQLTAAKVNERLTGSSRRGLDCLGPCRVPTWVDITTETTLVPFLVVKKWRVILSRIDENTIFTEKSFANRHKTMKFAKVFSLDNNYGGPYANKKQHLICSLIEKFLCMHCLHVHNHCSTQQDKYLCYWWCITYPSGGKAASMFRKIVVVTGTVLAAT